MLQVFALANAGTDSQCIFQGYPGSRADLVGGAETHLMPWRKLATVLCSYTLGWDAVQGHGVCLRSTTVVAMQHAVNRRFECHACAVPGPLVVNVPIGTTSKLSFGKLTNGAIVALYNQTKVRKSREEAQAIF